MPRSRSPRRVANVSKPNQRCGHPRGGAERDRHFVSGANTYGSGVTKVLKWNLKCRFERRRFGSQTSIQLTSGTLNLSGFNVGVGSITGDTASSINLGSNTLTMQNDAANTVYAGAIVGTGAINIIVTGNLDLTGNANTYSGGTTINSGNVYADNTISSSSATGLGTVTINVGGSLTIGNDSATGYIANIPVVDNGILGFSRTDVITFPNQITGTGGVEVQDGGTVTLTGNNTYSGLTAIDQATLKAGSSTALGSGTTALSFNYYGGTLNLNGFNVAIGSLRAATSSSGTSTSAPTLSPSEASRVRRPLTAALWEPGASRWSDPAPCSSTSRTPRTHIPDRPSSVRGRPSAWDFPPRRAASRIPAESRVRVRSYSMSPRRCRFPRRSPDRSA